MKSEPTTTNCRAYVLQKERDANLLFGNDFNAFATKPLYSPTTPSRATMPKSKCSTRQLPTSSRNKLVYPSKQYKEMQANFSQISLC